MLDFSKKLCNLEAIDEDSVNMWQLTLLLELGHIVYHIRYQSEFGDLISDIGFIEECVNEKDTSRDIWLHFGLNLFERGVRYLTRDGEEEFRSTSQFRFDPHITLHKRDQSLGNRESQPSSTIFLIYVRQGSDKGFVQLTLVVEPSA